MRGEKCFLTYQMKRVTACNISMSERTDFDE